MLENLADNTRTDKNTVHSYLPLYQNLLVNKKENAKHVLEVGIFKGGSIKLWNDFFSNAIIYGIDIINYDLVWDGIKNNDKIVLHTSSNAYDPDFVSSKFKNIKLDFALDDGPHTLESMLMFIRLYLPLIADDGILIIEDVQSIDWLNILANEVPENYKKYIRCYDLRNTKNRWDDIVFTIDKFNIQR